MVTITPSTRHKTYNPVTPTTAFPVSFPIFDNGDVKLFRDDVEVTGFTVTGNYFDGVCENATIHINPGIFGKIDVVGLRTPQRTDQYLNGRPLSIKDHNYSLNRLTIESQEARRDIDHVTGGLKAEIQDRIEGEALLNSRVDQETVDRINGDKALASLIGNVGSGNAPLFDTNHVVSLAYVSPLVNAIRTAGYWFVGDGGDALYIRVAIEPSHAGKMQSADGAWWELVTDVANVKLFGAKGDGVSDDSQSCQDAINFAQSVGVGCVYFPDTGAEYLLNSTLINDASRPLTLKGDGRGLSKLKGGASANPVIKIGDLSGYSSNPQRIIDMSFDYPQVALASHIRAEACVLDVFNIATDGGGSAISLEDAFSYTISDCSFGNTLGSAVYSGARASGHNSRITSNGFFGCGVGSQVSAIYVFGSDNILIQQNQIENCYRAFELSDCTSVRIASNYMEYGNDPFYFGFVSRRNSSIIMEGNWIAAYDNPTYIEYVDGLFFRGNTIWNQTIGFGPGANSSGICIGQNTLLTDGVINNPPWSIITLINGWEVGAVPLAVNATSDGLVSIRGVITRASGSGNQVAGTLPIAYRPRTNKRMFGINNSGSPVLVDININGNIYVEAGASFTGSVYLDVAILK